MVDIFGTSLPFYGTNLPPIPLNSTSGRGTSQNCQVTTLEYNLRWYLLTNLYAYINELYTELGIVRRIIDLPVVDSFSKGVIWQTETVSPAELKECKRG